jgi:hypothetical protein
MGCAVLVPLYLAVRLTGGSTAKLEELPDLLDRIKTPIVWDVPEGGVRTAQFFHAPPSEGHKFVLVRVQMEARMKIGYPVVPRCFALVADDGLRYTPKSRSPLFLDRGIEFYLERDETLDADLLFEIPASANAERLTFERYQAGSESPR